MVSYYKTIDNHLYKRLNSEYVLHICYEQGLMNILSPWVWDDILDDLKQSHMELIQITEEEFDKKAKAILHVLTTHLYEK